MAGTAVTPAPATGTPFNGGGGGAPSPNLSASAWNSLRIAAVIDRLLHHFRGHRITDTKEFLNLCLSLARSIDFAIGNNEVPSRSQDLPSVVKQVCQLKMDTHLQAGMMVLMISVKNACQIGWFSDGDSEELSNLAKEIGTSFCSGSNISTEPSCSHSVIPTVISRFYPRMKMSHIFASLDVKPGYDAYMADFHISRNMSSSPEDKIRLLVVQTDNIETSSCLVSPPKVNFLLNGRGVERRTNLFVDTGPQIPTAVNNYLKYGTNLLQAVGDFNGNYYIAVAFMSEVPNLHNSALQDYEQLAPATVDADSEIIVGSSRISLKCPISFKKIRTPVKGHSCNHIQCFDFDSYVDINSRRPSWRCPHCNQHVCFTDIRIDQKLVKILEEAGPNVSDVLISSDGSWNAVMESDDTVQKPDDTTINTGRDESPQSVDVLDLTEIDDVMHDVTHSETVDTKHLQNAQNITSQSNDQVGSDFWSAMFFSTFGVGPSNVRPNAHVPVSTSALTESFTSPVTEGALATITVPQNGTASPNMLLLHQYQFGNPPIITNEYGRFPALPRNVTRTPIAVQALPAQTPTSHPQRSYTNNNSVAPNIRLAASQASSAAQNFSTASRAHPRQGSPIPSSTLPQHSAVQVPNTFRVPNDRQRMPQSTTQSPRLIQPSTHSPGNFSCPQSTQQSQLIAAANVTARMSYDPLRTTPSYAWNPDVRSNSVTSPRDHQSANNFGITADGYDTTTDMNWRPAARMRGALSGQAYTEAYNQFIARPSQQAQTARPISNVTSVPITGGVVQGVPAPNYPSSAGSVGIPMGQDVLPSGPPGTH